MSHLDDLKKKLNELEDRYDASFSFLWTDCGWETAKEVLKDDEAKIEAVKKEIRGGRKKDSRVGSSTDTTV